MIGVAVSTHDLVKRYGRRRALDGFTLSVPRGSIMGLVGANGAGKTTWMMSVAGFLRTDGGDMDVLGLGPFDAARHSGLLSILPQDSALPLEASPENLLYRYARMQGMAAGDARASVARLLSAVNLDDRARSSIRALSHGMRKRVMLAQCFVGSPQVVLLDEPLNGLDPVEASRMRRFILARRGRQTIVVSSHNLNDIEALCTHVAFVEKGRVAKVSSLAAVTQTDSRVVYSLAAMPADMSALRAALPGAEFKWSEQTKELECDLGNATGGCAAANRALLPALLAQTDVIAVTSRQSLERAYLGE